MMRSLWIAKTGLDAMQSNLDTISNNLANVSTTAFKRVRPIFEDLMYQNLREPGLISSNGNFVPAGLQAGNGSHIASTMRVNTAGAMVHSDNPFDLAISGNGFFMLQTGPNSVGFTRAGNFMRDSTGNIVNSNGQQLLDASGGTVNIPSTATTIEIASDGKVSYYTSNTLVPNILPSPIAIRTFVNPTGLSSSGAGIYTETLSSGSPQAGTAGQNGFGAITQYYTEQSNVNVAEELVTLIAAQRAYEITAKSVTASDQMLQKLGQM
jgi:flagellar basal-body rod protein FlgG